MSYPRYPAYNASGVDWLGEIPAHWDVRRLKLVSTVNPRRAELTGLPDDLEVSFVPMEFVGEYGGLTLEVTKPIREVSQGYTYFRDGDVVVAKITPCFENGKGAIATKLTSGIAFGTTELHVLRAHPQMMDRRFLFYVSVCHPFRKQGEAEMYGAGGQKRIPESFILDFRQPIPPLSEQHAIAVFLDRKTAELDALIAEKERLLALLQEKRAALITQAVTKGLDPSTPMKDSGVAWLGEIPAHWEVAPVYSRYEVALGKMLDAKQITGEHLAPYVRNVHVQWDYVDVTDLPQMDFTPDERVRYRLKKGDLLVCEGGEVGRTAIWRGEIDECYYQKAIHRVRPRLLVDDSRYFYYVMYSTAKMGVFVAGGNPNTIDHLTGVQLRHYRFPLPTGQEQRLISAYLDARTREMDSLFVEIETGIRHLQEYRTALISAAVTGKIDVRAA